MTGIALLVPWVLWMCCSVYINLWGKIASMAALPLSQMSSSATDLKTKHLWAALELLRRTRPFASQLELSKQCFQFCSQGPRHLHNDLHEMLTSAKLTLQKSSMFLIPNRQRGEWNQTVELKSTRRWWEVFVSPCLSKTSTQKCCYLFSWKCHHCGISCRLPQGAEEEGRSSTGAFGASGWRPWWHRWSDWGQAGMF